MKKKVHNLVLISESLKALAHPNRINILALLMETKKVKISVSEISANIKLSQPETSRHLSILKNKKILVSERVGSNIYYSVNKTNVIFNCIENLLNKS
jgi:DNA-binding transcriptional ArsR family regulator